MVEVEAIGKMIMNIGRNSSAAWRSGLGLSLTALFFFSCLVNCRAQAEDVEQLARLSGTEYLQARDRFLADQRKPIALPPDAKPTWSAELLTMILNVRIENKDEFAKWDGFVFEPTVLRDYHRPHPLVNRDPQEWGNDIAAQCFLIEQIWKGVWYERNKSEAVSVVLGVRILGPLSTWQRVYEGADRAELRALALSALASDPSKWKLLHEALKRDQTSSLEKQAVFRGLAKINNPRVREFVAETIDQWKPDPSVTLDALLALAVQTDDQSRRDLYSVMMNKAMPMEVRESAALRMANQPRQGDAEYIEKLVAEAEKKDFPSSVVASIVLRYSSDDVRGLIEKIFRTSKNEELIVEVLRRLEFRIGKADEFLLDIVQSRKDVSDEVLQWVSRVRETIPRDP